MDDDAETRAIATALAVAADLGLPAETATVLHHSNKLALRLDPVRTFARVAPLDEEVAQMELDVATRLGTLGAPVALPDPRLPTEVHRRDGVAITFWTLHEQLTPAPPAAVAAALHRLHAALRAVGGTFPHATDRVDDALRIVTDPTRSPDLPDRSRTDLAATLHRLRAAVAGTAGEQLLHGEPHPGNVLSTADGPLLIDLETLCRGPVELDVAHLPDDVVAHYPGLDPHLLQDCRELVLALVAAWRWDAADAFPDGRRFGEELLRTLAAGPPWPSLDVVVARVTSA